MFPLWVRALGPYSRARIAWNKMRNVWMFCHMQWNRAIFHTHTHTLDLLLLLLFSSSIRKLKWNISKLVIFLPCKWAGYFWARHAQCTHTHTHMERARERERRRRNNNNKKRIDNAYCNEWPTYSQRRLFIMSYIQVCIYSAHWMFAHAHNKTGDNKWVNFIFDCYCTSSLRRSFSPISCLIIWVLSFS